MARWAREITIRESGERSKPIQWKGFAADLEGIRAIQLDEHSVMLASEAYYLKVDDSLEASWRDDTSRDEHDAQRCWKTTVVYEQIGENHPHVVPFKHRDSCTGFPVLAKPSGPPLTTFIEQHSAAMYSGPQDAPTTRLLPSFRPLAYQWALHIISGLAFVHSHNVVFGDPSLAECWLASDSRFSLSLVGFANAGFNYFKEWSAVYPGERKSSMEFHPFDDRDGPTQQTDLFLWGCIVYELMTGYWPLTPEALSRQYTTQELEARIVRKEWPRLEPEHMGTIVRRCWNGEYASAEEVKAAVKTFLQGLGWEIEGNDDLKGFCATDLFLQEQQ